MSGTNVNVNAELLSNPKIAAAIKEELGPEAFEELEVSLYGQLGVTDAKKMMAGFEKEENLLILLRTIHLMIGDEPTIEKIETELATNKQALTVLKALPAYDYKQLLSLVKPIFGLDCFKMRKSSKSAESSTNASFNPL